jgi:hypothetical protein
LLYIPRQQTAETISAPIVSAASQMAKIQCGCGDRQLEQEQDDGAGG